MRIFTYGETPPNLPAKAEQPPLSFKAVPYYTGDKEIDALSLSDEMLVSKDKFPLIEDFELIIIDGRQYPNGMGPRGDATAHFIDRAKNQFITYWDMYYIDTRPMNMEQVPIPQKGELIDEMELGYQIIMTADDNFIYLAQGQDDHPPVYTSYAKIPKDRYESEWKAFIDWYHKHPEKRHPHPTPEERMAHSARNPDGSLKKRGNWLSKLFK
jgi:hypothetical protein